MNLAAGILGLCVLLALTGCVGGSSVESRLKQQYDYLNEKDWRDLYETCSEDWREDNDYSDWKGDWETGLALMGMLDKKFSVADIEVEVDGDEATVSYKTRADDVVISSEEDEVWVKEGGKWYQEQCD